MKVYKRRIKDKDTEKFNIFKFFGNMLSIKNSARLNALKRNNVFQLVILILGLSVIGFYIIGYSLQLGEILRVIDANEKAYEKSNNMLYEVESYSSDKEGLLTVKLKDGDTVKYVSSEDYKFVLTRKLKQNVCMLDKKNNILLCGLSNDYGKNILTGNNVYMIWCFAIFMTLLLICGVVNKMKVLGGRIGTLIFGVEVITLYILTMFTLTYF